MFAGVRRVEFQLEILATVAVCDHGGLGFDAVIREKQCDAE